jgi:hypothetical protein
MNRESFFLDGNGSMDYLAIREGRNQLCVSVRDFIEGVWPRCKQYLDSDVQIDARENFHQRWWEIYLTHSLMAADVQLVKREYRQPRKSGPDLLAQVDGRKLWIEAVAALPGEGPDAVRSYGPRKAPRPFPDKEIMLRFQQAFSAKVSAHARYVEKNWVSPLEGYIVALNGALAERGYPCMQRFPRIVSALLLGLEKQWVQVEFDGVTSRTGEVHYDYQTEVEKKSKGPVTLAAFRDPANSCVSAVLYSASDAYMERELVLVLNPHAQVPLPPDFLSAIPRYWVELHDDRLILHLPPDSGS